MPFTIIRYTADPVRRVSRTSPESPATEGSLFQQSESERAKKYFVTFRKFEKDAPQPVVVDVVVEAPSKKQARMNAQAIAKRELKDFQYVGVS